MFRKICHPDGMFRKASEIVVMNPGRGRIIKECLSDLFVHRFHKRTECFVLNGTDIAGNLCLQFTDCHRACHDKFAEINVILIKIPDGIDPKLKCIVVVEHFKRELFHMSGNCGRDILRRSIPEFSVNRAGIILQNEAEIRGSLLCDALEHILHQKVHRIPFFFPKFLYLCHTFHSISSRIT